MNNYQYNRRNFLKAAGLVSAGLSTAKSSLFNLRNIGAVAGQEAAAAGDYKALVCLYLGGGSDSFNILVPRGASEYAEYAATRSNLALAQDQLLPISPINVGGIEYGLHPMMTNIQQFFNQGKACMISNIGSLIQPVTKSDFYNETAPLPLGLFSHSDQMNQWQTASPSVRLIKGWAGRISDLLYEVNTNTNISMNVSFAGTNVFQSSDGKIEFSVNNDGAIGLSGYGDTYNYRPQRSTAIDELLAFPYNDPFKDSYKDIFRTSIDSNLKFNQAIKKVPVFNSFFTDDYLSNNFKMAAKIMAAREDLGFTKQIFYIDIGGWDTHDSLLGEQDYLLMLVDRALGEFHAAIDELGLTDNVVTFTMSEFGRTLTSNGNGTDHAWGGNVMAIGGPVKGNSIYGTYPSLVLDNDLDIGGGVLIPTLSNDLYFSELALWLGVPASELNTIFPNLSNFYTPGSSQAPIGFLNI